MRILLAVDASTPALSDDDRILAEAMRLRGVDPVPHLWGDRVEAGSTVVIRSTWDYVEHPDRFAAWLDHLDEIGATVINPTPVLRWNAHKRYLLELAAGGVPVVPTELVSRPDFRTLDQVRAERGWSEVVVKPAVGGTARLTIHSGRVGTDRAAEHFERLLADEDVLVQPVVAEVLTAGEISVVAIGGTPRAAFLKRPAPDDWRVQSDFGGSVTAIDLTDDLAAITIAALADRPTAYARVDVVRWEQGWAVMELELIEPELYFRLDRSLAAHLADQLAVELGLGR